MHERAGLTDPFSQHPAKRRMQEMGRSVVSLNGPAELRGNRE